MHNTGVHLVLAGVVMRHVMGTWLQLDVKNHCITKWTLLDAINICLVTENLRLSNTVMCHVMVTIGGGSILRVSRVINIPEGMGIHLAIGTETLMMLGITWLGVKWIEDGQSVVIMKEITWLVLVLQDLYVLVGIFIQPRSHTSSKWHRGLTSIV